MDYNFAERRKVERRKAGRLKIPLRLKFKLQGKSKECISDDVSGKGLKVSINSPAKINKKINVLINIGKEKPISAMCRVAWSKERFKNNFQAGLEFLSIKDEIDFVEFICDKMLDLSQTKNMKKK